jgi:hypothetical protein
MVVIPNPPDGEDGNPVPSQAPGDVQFYLGLTKNRFDGNLWNEMIVLDVDKSLKHRLRLPLTVKWERDDSRQ